MMAEPFNFELTITDFLKYMPEAKRHDYELMLRRCNFSDPADPMFPVMLFLLFFQDNLKQFDDQRCDSPDKIRVLSSF